MTSRLGFAAAVVPATVANYVAWLGWGRQKTHGADGYLHGPYETWQVAGVVIVMGMIAIALGWVGHVLDGAVIVAASTAVLFLAEASSSSENDGLGGVGAGLVGIGSFCGVAAIAAIAGLARAARSRVKPF